MSLRYAVYCLLGVNINNLLALPLDLAMIYHVNISKLVKSSTRFCVSPHIVFKGLSKARYIITLFYRLKPNPGLFCGPLGLKIFIRTSGFVLFLSLVFSLYVRAIFEKSFLFKFASLYLHLASTTISSIFSMIGGEAGKIFSFTASASYLTIL